MPYVTEQRRDRVIAGLRWARETVDAAKEASPPWCGESDQGLRPIDKMVVEAALLAFLCDRDPSLRIQARELAASVASRSDICTRAYELIRWRPYLRTSIGLLWVVLDHFEMGDLTRRINLRALWEREPHPPQPHERASYRILDQAWVRSMVSQRQDPLLRSAGLISATALMNSRAGLHMNRDDLYALTHGAMYISDFGKAGRAPGDAVWTGALAASRITIGDFDLAGELALAAILIDSSEAQTSITATLTILDWVFDQLAYVPAPTFDAGEYEACGLSEGYLRYHSYHTTFVYTLLNCLASTCRTGLSLDVREVGPRPPFSAEQDSRMQLHEQVAQTFDSWRTLIAYYGHSVDTTQLLRLVVDAHIINVAARDDLDALTKLIGMGTLVGGSPVEDEAVKLIDDRATMTIGLADGPEFRTRRSVRRVAP